MPSSCVSSRSARRSIRKRWSWSDLSDSGRMMVRRCNKRGKTKRASLSETNVSRKNAPLVPASARNSPPFTSVHTHAAAQKLSGRIFAVSGRERAGFWPGRRRNALRAAQTVRQRDVMVKTRQPKGVASFTSSATNGVATQCSVLQASFRRAGRQHDPAY